MVYLKKIFFTLISFICYCITFTAKSQYNRLHFKYLTSEDGLTQSVTNEIFTDSRGFVWMTGLDGINRFDGLRCLQNNEIAPGLPNIARTNGIVEDNNGNIWFGYAEGIIRFSYELNLFELIKLPITQFEKPKSEIGFPVPAAVDKNNNLLINYSPSLIFFYNLANHKLRAVSPVPNLSGYYGPFLIKGKKGSIDNDLYYMLFTKDSFYLFRINGLSYQPKTWNLVTSAKWTIGIGAAAVLQNDSTMIIQSADQIAKYYFNSGQLETKRFPFLIKPAMSIDIFKNIWISTANDGVYVVDGKTLEIKKHFTYGAGNTLGIKKGTASFINCDSRGNVWLSIFGSGIAYCNVTDINFSSAYTTDHIKKQEATNMTRDIVEDNFGNFYCAVNRNIVLLDKNLNYIKKLPLTDNITSIPDLYLQDNLLFIAADLLSAPELLVFNLTKNTLLKITHVRGRNLKSDLIYQFSPMNDDNLLVGTYGGIWKLNITNLQFQEIPGITDTTEVVVFSHVDRHGQFYKGVNIRGFAVYQQTLKGYKNVFDLEKKITVKHCVEISDTLMWIGTTDGLYLFNTDKLKVKKHYTTNNGLANNVVYAIMPDKRGNLWLGTNKGLSYFDVRSEQFKNFSKADGLPGNEFNTHAVIKAKDGRIIFGAMNGLTIINQEILNKETPMPIAHVTKIITDSSFNPFAYNTGNRLHLPAGNSAIDFEITALDYINPAACKIQYRLKGHDNSWHEADNPALIRFVKISPGEYELEYRVSNTMGKWSAEIKNFSFSIGAYWWQTKWFKMTAILALVMISFLFIRLYTRNKLHKQKSLLEKYMAVQKERERIISDLHDDVGATLSSMHIYGDLAKEVWEEQPDKSKEMVKKMTLQSKELMNRMGDIVWSLKSPAEEKNSFIVRLRNYSHELLAEKGIVADFDIDEISSEKIINPLARKNILLIAKEAINNIVKYSKATRVVISLKNHEEKLLFSVSDNGKGFDKENNRPGNGLENMKQRCLQLNGVFSLNTKPGEGVNIICEVPIAIISHLG